MKAVVPLLLIAIALPGATAGAQTGRRPGKAAQAVFKGCRWGRVDGRTLSIWSFACGRSEGEQRLVPADDVRGFAIVPPTPGPGRQIVIRTFTKPAAAPVASILPQVLKITGRYRRSCRLVAHRSQDWGTVWTLEPTGAEMRAYDKASEAEPQPNPCGDLGIGPAGDRFFRVLPGDPTRVIYADMGSEIQIFDLDSLRKR